MRLIHIVSEADLDLLNIGVYLQSKSPDASVRFVSAVEKTLDELAKNPEIGARCATKKPSLAGLRIWQVRGFKSYLIFYRFTTEQLEVVRVRHSSTDWVGLFQSENPA
ncbi:MAG: type II toxin-antitoxin system RelE/ParE family toxin [Pirellulales bacterium]